MNLFCGTKHKSSKIRCVFVEVNYVPQAICSNELRVRDPLTTVKHNTYRSKILENNGNRSDSDTEFKIEM